MLYDFIHLYGLLRIVKKLGLRILKLALPHVQKQREATKHSIKEE